MEKYDEISVVRSLSKKQSIRIDRNNIIINRGAMDLGNGSWGKIDYLRHYCGYSVIYEDRTVAQHEETSKHKLTKQERKEEKFSMANMAKQAMKNTRKQ